MTGHRCDDARGANAPGPTAGGPARDDPGFLRRQTCTRGGVRLRAAAVAGLLLAFLVAAAHPSGAEGLTALHIHGDPYAIAGAGRTFTYGPSDGTFTALHGVSDYGNGTVVIHFRSDTDEWDLVFSAPANAPLAPGVYENTRDSYDHPPGSPGLSVVEVPIAYRHTAGRFAVLEAVYGEDGEVVRFAADFQVQCIVSYCVPDQTVFGSIRYNAETGLSPRVFAGPAAAFEGDGEPRSLVFPIWLSEPAAEPVAVDYATGGGDAVAGTDYTPAAGTARIGTGESLAEVPVPVLGNTAVQPDRTLRFTLSGLTGATMGFAEAAGTILDDDDGRTFLAIQSDPGDIVGYGRTLMFTPFDGGFSIGPDPLGGFNMTFDTYGDWIVRFAPPRGHALVPGVYENAQEYPHGSPVRPGLLVAGEGWGCNRVDGRFVVHEVTYGPGGEIDRLALDFEQHCEGLPDGLYGYVRINSTVAAVPRISVAPAAAYEGDGEARSLWFQLSLSAPATVPVTVDYATVEGTAKAGTDFSPVSGTAFFAPGDTTAFVEVPLIGNTGVEDARSLTLALSNPSGAPLAFGEGTGTILDDDAARSFLYVDLPWSSDTGRATVIGTPLDGVFVIQPEDNGLDVTLDAGALYSWGVALYPPPGERLAPGVYEVPRREDSNRPTGRIGFGQGGTSCGFMTGRFTILELEYGEAGDVTKLAADFEGHCSGAVPATYGSIRINSELRVTPRLSVAPAATYEGDGEPEELRFRVSLSAPSSDPVKADFATVEGSARAGVDFSPVKGTVFLAPGQTSLDVTVPVHGNTEAQPDRELTLALSGPSGAPVAFGAATGRVADDDDIRTVLYIASQAPEEPVGLGRTYFLRPLNGSLTPIWTDHGGVRFVFDGTRSFLLRFDPALGEPLAPGLYDNAVGISLTARPILDVGGEGRSCSPLTGKFEVFEFQRGQDGSLERFAADFEQHCAYAPYPLFGAIRYNSSVPIVRRRGLDPRGTPLRRTR